MDLFVFADAGSISMHRFAFSTFRLSTGFGTRLELINRMPVILGMGFPVNKINIAKYANSSSLWEASSNHLNYNFLGDNSMKRRLGATFLTTLFCLSAFAADPAPQLGVVNFSTCVSDSKLGMQEQASFETLKKQMASLLEDTENNSMISLLNSTTPTISMVSLLRLKRILKISSAPFNEDLNRYQNQYYQVMNQANMRIVQTLSNGINAASEKVAKSKKLSVVLNKEACFYYMPALDVTKMVIAEMDKAFVPDAKKPATPPPASDAEGAKTEQKTK